LICGPIEPRSKDLLRAIDAYLSLAHVMHPELGCVLPTLGAEVARAPTGTRAIFERAMGELTAVVREKVGHPAAASALVSLCVGAVTLARGLATESAKREVLAAARTGARTILAAVETSRRRRANRNRTR
jgi:hypothetical protein